MNDNIKDNVFVKIFNAFTNRIFFTAVYLITSILWYFPLISSYFKFPMKLTFLWGIFIIAYDFFTKRVMFTGYKSFLLVLFGISYLMTILTNMDNMYTGIKQFIYNGILIYVVYAFSSDKTEEEYRKWLTVINDIIAAIILVASFVSIVMFIARFTYTFSRGDMTFAQGIYYNRLHGVYTSANTGAIFSVLCIALIGVIYSFDKPHFKKFKVYYIINIIVQFNYYSLTLSRGGKWMTVAALLATSLIFAYPYFMRHRKKVVAVVLSVLFFAVTYTAVWGLTFAARNTMLFLNNSIYSQRGTSHGENEEDEKDNTIELERVDSEKEMTNGRLTIWQAGLAILKQKPLFGVCDADIYFGDELTASIEESKLTENNISELKRANGYMHNAVVQIVVCSGIIGLLIFIAFAATVALKYIRSLISFYGTETYSSLAVIFVLLCMLVSQIASEAHILFNRQDPYATLFWLYLGFGMFIIKNNRSERNSRNLFVCDTPYQVMNSIRIAKEKSEEISDIYVLKQFKNADAVALELESCGIFDQVVVFEPYKKYSNPLQKAVTVLRILFPLRTLKNYSEKRFKTHQYSEVYFSYYTPFSDSVKLVNSNSDFIQYEDGIGTYRIDNLENLARTKIFDFINKFFLSGSLSYNVKKLYLNHPEHYVNSKNIITEKIPPIEDYSLFNKMFGYKPNDIYKNNRFVFLTQPLEETSLGETAADTEQKILSALGKNVIVRVHPRQNAENYSGYTVDGVNNQWELECADSITDSHILIGAFSTAQFTPKMLFDKEPTVIFTYKLYGNAFENADDTVNMLRSMYKNPEKVIVAEDINQLADYISK